jgi:hypothetical protein
MWLDTKSVCYCFFQMLNIMKGIKHPECEGGKLVDSEISLRPMNLSTMLSSHSLGERKRKGDSSLSPRSPRPHHRDLDDDIVDSSGAGGRGRHSSGGSNEAAAAADIRTQFLADLRRLGSNIPTQSTSAGNGEHQPASSTTHSPTPPPPTHPPTIKREEENLPPRKRKVSQEHHHHPSQDDRNPYNGIHSDSNPVQTGSREQQQQHVSPNIADEHR